MCVRACVHVCAHMCACVCAHVCMCVGAGVQYFSYEIVITYQVRWAEKETEFMFQLISLIIFVKGYKLCGFCLCRLH